MVKEAISQSYEKGQEDLIKEILNLFDDYAGLEEKRLDVINSGLLKSEDPEVEKRFKSLTNQQEEVKEALKDIFGDDMKVYRMKNVIYMKIGEVTRW